MDPQTPNKRGKDPQRGKGPPKGQKDPRSYIRVGRGTHPNKRAPSGDRGGGKGSAGVELAPALFIFI